MRILGSIWSRGGVAAGVSYLALLSASTALAQESGSVDEVIVTGARASLSKALAEKRGAIGTVDGIFGEDIGKFPDLNVAESLQRVPGVTITRSVTGEGNQVSLRGLPSEFVAVTLNGMPGASGNAGREFDFDVFASELFAGARVTKTPSADLTEGGLAGTIDLRTPNALDLHRSGGVLSVGGQYARLGDGEARPRVSGLANWRNTDGTFGVIASAAWSESLLRNDTRQGFRYQMLGASSGLDELVRRQQASGGAPPTVIVDGSPVNDPAALLKLAAETAYPILPRVGIDLRNRERLGVTGGLQFQPNDRLNLAVNVLYAQFDERGERHTIDGAPGFSGTNGVDTVPTRLTIRRGGAVPYAVAGEFTRVAQRVESIEETFNSKLWHTTANLDFQLSDDLKASGAIGYSTATEDELRRSYLYTHTGTWSYDLTDPQWPKFAGADFDYLNPAAYTTPDRPRFRPFERKDRIWRGRGDLAWSQGLGALTTLRGGFEYVDREKQNIQFLETRPSTTVPFSEVYKSLPVNDFNKGAPSGGVRDFLVVDLDKGRERLLPDSFFQIAGPDLRGTWIVREKVTSGYGQSLWNFNIAGRPLVADLGVRITRTDQTSDGFQQVGATYSPVSVDNRYTDVLPSVNLRWSASDRWVLRASANRAITRPTLTQLSAGATVGSTNNLTASKGNPNLDPFRANQFDAAVEWYFAPESLLSATVFYKDMQSFIVNSSTKQVITGPNLINDAGQDVSGREFTVTLPVNGSGGKLQGLELSYQQPFSFLPSPFDGFGMLVNLTLTKSEGTTVQGGREIRQALQGQSDLSYNVIAYYEKGPFSIRGAFTHRSKYADQFRTDIWPGGEPHTLYVDERRQLDVSLRYQVTPAIGVYVDAINLTSTDYYSYDTEPGMSRDYFEQGPVFNFGLRARF